MEETLKRNPWLEKASMAFEVSTSYVDNNYRAQWEKNISLFKSKHPAGSKYHSDSYRFRAKQFRPKTRSMVRQNEAAAAAAFFTNMDAVSIDPVNRKDMHQKASAELRDGILNYRLQHTIPWYLICVGGMQDAQVQGVVASKQYWKIKTRKINVVDEEGNEVEAFETIKDEPCVDLLPIERVRIDPAAKWYDPINTSPYVILQEPMYIYEVKDFIKAGKWKEVDDKAWSQALIANPDTTRQARESGKEDTQEPRHGDALSDFDKVWVHENFICVNGIEKHYYTLGTHAMLTDPKDLGDVYWHDMRPVALGCTILETHNILPAGTVELGEPLQKETNELANSRLDNIKLVLNKRYIVKRGQQVDLRSLIRNASGSITLANDPDGDVREMEFNDVTGSSYAEQDRLNLDYDELLGNFSNSSVQSNRKLNETVGGMSMLRQGANAMTQYLVSIFAETWVEKVLRQLDALEQAYETDTDLLAMIADERDIQNKYGITAITPGLLQAKCKVVVNMTNSATDPMIRLEQFLVAMQKYMEMVAIAPPDMDMSEVRKEIFGRLGYKDGSRFFVNQDSDLPQVIQQMQGAIQQLTQQIEDQTAKAQAEQQGKLAIAQMQEQNKERLERIKQEAEDERLQRKLEAERRTLLEKAILESQTSRQNAKLDSDTKLATAKIADNTKRQEILAAPKETEKEPKEEKEESPAIGDINLNLAIDNTKGEVKKTITLDKTKSGYSAEVVEKPKEE
ncbi:MAG: hypothetical protein OES84_00145 [Kiritimatiellaceae bacterium]|nr:hypothetical protein [Kiritimatiellaceae bacterium]